MFCGTSSPELLAALPFEVAEPSGSENETMYWCHSWVWFPTEGTEEQDIELN
jgi:hypothetical protein